MQSGKQQKRLLKKAHERQTKQKNQIFYILNWVVMWSGRIAERREGSADNRLLK